MKWLCVAALVAMTAACTHTTSETETPVVDPAALKIQSWPDGKAIDEASFFRQLATQNVVILAEVHSIRSVQLAEARIIKGVAGAKGQQRTFEVGWEFLNCTDDATLEPFFNLQAATSLNLSGLRMRVGLTDPRYDHYEPTLQGIKDSGARLFGTNVSMADRKTIIANGLTAATKLPCLNKVYACSDAQRDLFSERAGAHARTPIINRYFDAQCASDNAMADALAARGKDSLRIMIAGSVHAEFGLGLVEQLKNRNIEKVVVVRLTTPSLEKGLDPPAALNTVQSVANFVITTADDVTPAL